MSEPRSDDEIRADLDELDRPLWSEAWKSEAPALRLARDVVPLLARVSELEQERDAYKRAKEENDDRFMLERDEARARAERAEAQVRAVEAERDRHVHDGNGECDDCGLPWQRVGCVVRRRLDSTLAAAALSGLSLQEEQE